jgi:hypothetical protein
MRAQAAGAARPTPPGEAAAVSGPGRALGLQRLRAAAAAAALPVARRLQLQLAGSLRPGPRGSTCHSLGSAPCSRGGGHFARRGRADPGCWQQGRHVAPADDTTRKVTGWVEPPVLYVVWPQAWSVIHSILSAADSICRFELQNKSAAHPSNAAGMHAQPANRQACKQAPALQCMQLMCRQAQLGRAGLACSQRWCHPQQQPNALNSNSSSPLPYLSYVPDRRCGGGATE